MPKLRFSAFAAAVALALAAAPACAQVQWRHGDELGIAFAAEASGKAGEALAERVKKLEAEVAALRKMLRRLKAELASSADEAA